MLNVTYPLVPAEVSKFAEGKESLLVVEEGEPDFIEQALGSILFKAGAQTRLFGKDVLPMAEEYTGQVLLDGISGFLRQDAPEMLPGNVRASNKDAALIPDLSNTVPVRPPGFCTGCPERPIFAALKLVQKDLGEHQINGDIGFHLFAALPPFEIGGSTTGYRRGPASNAALDGGGEKRAICAIALAELVNSEPSLERAFARYQDERRLEVLRLQSAARNSLEWFEQVERFLNMDLVQCEAAGTSH